MQIDQIREALRDCNQIHLLNFWEELSAGEQAELLADLSRVDFEQVARLIPTHVLAAPEAHLPSTIEPAPVVTAEPGTARRAGAAARGARLIGEGKVAALVVAGGQGTRLGYDGPKGMFEISPVAGKSLFRLFAEFILGSERRYGGTIPWYIMTSETNDRVTRDYFTEHDYFGLKPANVTFFKQGMMPAIGPDGRILLDQKHRVAMSPDGHGGTLRALAATGALADMADRGVDAISYFQVDNPLASPVDPVFVGLHDESRSEASSISVHKADDLERVGNFARVDGKVCVIEYSDLPEARARARDANGNRVLDLASIAIHVFSRSFIERLTADIRAIKLPWHRAVKKVPYVDPDTGTRVEPDTPNAVKLEMFVFDTLPLAERTLIYLTDRAEVFSPVKNATGIDSPETSRRDMIRRAGSWLRGAGVEVPTWSDGDPDAAIEISPLFALDADHLAEVLMEKPTVSSGDSLYLG